MALCFGTGIPIACFISINHHHRDLVVLCLSKVNWRGGGEIGISVYYCVLEEYCPPIYMTSRVKTA
jgi:hypothetical protein